jgi:hypothetical protein
MLKEISIPFIMEDFDAELVELTPLDEKDQMEYDKIKTPENWSFSPNPKIIKSDVIDEIEKSFFKVHPNKFLFSGKDVLDYESHIILSTMLKWYNRSLEYKGILDKFISLWVTFNIIYDYLWKCNHPTEKTPRYQSVKISDCICLTLKEDECKQILEPCKFVLLENMPSYELIVHEGEDEKIREIIKSKNIKEIEKYHKEFLKTEKDWRLNKNDSWLERKGLNFGKYWLIEDWVNSLAQVMLNIYGVRNLVFHCGEVPIEAVEGIIDDSDSFQYWSMLNDILSKVNALLITKILSKHF